MRTATLTPWRALAAAAADLINVPAGTHELGGNPIISDLTLAAGAAITAPEQDTGEYRSSGNV
jgi:hypothetical protein